MYLELRWLWAYQRVVGWVDEHETTFVHRWEPKIAYEVEEPGFNVVFLTDRELKDV